MHFVVSIIGVDSIPGLRQRFEIYPTDLYVHFRGAIDFPHLLLSSHRVAGNPPYLIVFIHPPTHPRTPPTIHSPTHHISSFPPSNPPSNPPSHTPSQYIARAGDRFTQWIVHACSCILPRSPRRITQFRKLRTDQSFPCTCPRWNRLGQSEIILINSSSIVTIFTSTAIP